MIIEQIKNNKGAYDSPVEIIVDLNSKASIKKMMQAWVDS